MRVSVIGNGAIGQRVIAALLSEAVPDAQLVGVVVRSPLTNSSIETVDAAEAELAHNQVPSEVDPAEHLKCTIERAIAISDIIVECAGVQAVQTMGPQIIHSGVDLILSSVGALADDELRHELFETGPGNCRLTEGAIGGLDLLAAAARDPLSSGGLDTLQLTTTKRAETLVQPWMDEELAKRLRTSDIPTTLFQGNVRDAISQYPRSLNVAVSLAAATNMWEHTEVRLIASPFARLTSHIIEANGSAGTYRFEITNHPLESNPTSSAVVSAAILHAIAKLSRPSGTFV